MERPEEYNWAGIALLISGIFNLWIGAILFLSLIFVCIGVLWIVPLAIGVIEVVTGARMLAGKRVHSVVPVAALGVVGSMMNFNVIGIGGEVVAIALVLSRPVARWLEADDEGAGAEW